MHKKSGLLGFLCNRELGKNTSFDCPSNISQVIAEEKSTIPIVNKACELSGQCRSTFLVAFSSDRSLIASTHGDHSVRVSDIKTGKCRHVLHGHPRTPWTIAFHPTSNDIVASGCLGGQVRIWDLRGGGCEVWKSEDGRVIASVAFHPSDQLLVIATMNELLFWDWSKPEPFAKCKTGTSHERVRWCKFDPFGHYLYTGIANKSTIQSEELPFSNTTNIELPTESGVGGAGGASASTSEPGHLWDQYRRVVEEITANQRERIQLQQGLLRDSNVDPMLQSDIDIVEPTSPQASALRSAQQYAARITNEAQQRRNRHSNQYGTNPLYRPLQPPQPVLPPHIEIGRVEGPSAPDFEDTEEHMQQIHRIPNIYATTSSSNNNQPTGSGQRGLDTLARAAETVSQMDSQQADRSSNRNSSPSSRSWGPLGSSAHNVFPFHRRPSRERLLGYSMDINDNVTPQAATSRVESSNRISSGDSNLGSSSSRLSNLALPRSTSGGGSLYRRSSFGVPRYSASALPPSPRGLRPLPLFHHRPMTTSPNTSDSLSSSIISNPLTSSTLERVLNRNRDEPLEPLPSDLNLDFLSDIQVSMPNSSTTSLSSRSTPSRSVTTTTSATTSLNQPHTSSLSLGYYRLRQLVMESESEVESITSTPVTLTSTSRDLDNNSGGSRDSGLGSSSSRPSVAPVYVSSHTRSAPSPLIWGDLSSDITTRSRGGAPPRPNTVRGGASSILLSRLSSSSPSPTNSNSITSRSPPVLSTTPAVPPSLILPETVRPNTRTRVLPDTLTVTPRASAMRAMGRLANERDTIGSRLGASGREAMDRAMERLRAAGRTSPGGAARERSLMTLLEAPLPSVPSILNQSSSVTGTPQPVPPPDTSTAQQPETTVVTQSAFVARNREVREALTRANEEATSSSMAVTRPIPPCRHHSAPYHHHRDNRRLYASLRQRSQSLLRHARQRGGSTLNRLRTSLSFDPDPPPIGGGQTSPSSLSTATVSIVTPTPTSIITSIPTSEPTSRAAPDFSQLPDPTSLTNQSSRAGDLTSLRSNATSVLADPTTFRATDGTSNLSDGIAHQPQRLATIIETEVREAINRIRSHTEVGLSQTLRDLDSLQRNLGVETIVGAPNTEALDDVSESTQDVNPPTSTSPLLTSQPDVITSPPLDHDVVIPDLTSSTHDPPMDTVLEVTVENSNSPPPTSSGGRGRGGEVASPAGSADSPANQSNEGLLAISNISSVLGERIQELDERVNSIQTRLRESMQALDRQSRSYGGGRSTFDDIHSPGQLRARRLRERFNERRLQRRQQRGELNRARRAHPGVAASSSSSRPFATAGSHAAMHERLQQIQARAGARDQERRERRRQYQWHAMRRRHLHRDYNVNILDDTINRQDDLQAAINRTIAGAFIANGEASVASNIVTLTHRIQRWDLTGASNRGRHGNNNKPHSNHKQPHSNHLNSVIPDITNADVNIVVRSCKLHNDATADISQDGRYLATFVSTTRGFPDDTVLGVFSLERHNLGQCLYTKSFGPNAISVSISPLDNYVMVGLAAKRLQWVWAAKQMVAQIYKLKTVGAGEDSMEHICDLMHPCDLDLRVHVSVNSARWLPGVGEGVVYCTNRGDLHICKPGTEAKSLPTNESSDDRQQNYTRQLVMQLLRIQSPRTNNSATQTSTQGVRRTASTQTDHVALLSTDSDSD